MVLGMGLTGQGFTTLGEQSNGGTTALPEEGHPAKRRRSEV